MNHASISMSDNNQKIKKRYNRIAGWYDIMETPMEFGFSKWRQSMLDQARGQTLEVGIGTGKNIPYYPDHVKLTGIDFSEKMISVARKRYGDRGNVGLRVMDAQQMDFPDDSFDTIVTSCVFCSVPDPVQGLKEIRRVSRPGGQILMLEHVRSHKPVIGPMMDLLNPLPLNIYGANINRETEDNLLRAGFTRDEISVTNLWMDVFKAIRIQNMKDARSK
jgi:ubiquinone/menaquinone biosynthesis C-methylase UbiE